MHNRSNLYLIGYMACGKSTVASRLSEIFHVRKLEMDEVIEGRAGMSISEIFEKFSGNVKKILPFSKKIYIMVSFFEVGD